MDNLTTSVIVFGNESEQAMVLLPKTAKTKRKCQPFQGKLNQLIVTAKHVAGQNGHFVDRFDRNYETGTAVGICKNCSCSVTVDAKNNRVGGGELETACEKF